MSHKTSNRHEVSWIELTLLSARLEAKPREFGELPINRRSQNLIVKCVSSPLRSFRFGTTVTIRTMRIAEADDTELARYPRTEFYGVFWTQGLRQFVDVASFRSLVIRLEDIHPGCTET